MQFKDVLEKYIKELDCKANTLANYCNISPSVLSRYRSGDRVPDLNSNQIEKLSKGIYDLSINKKLNYTIEEIKSNLIESIKKKDYFDYQNFSQNFNEIIIELKINLNDMAKYTSFDASHLSRIRHGKTRPTEPNELAQKIACYIKDKFTQKDDLKKIKKLIKYNENKSLSDQIKNWLINNDNTQNNYNIKNFLTNLDQFNLDDYIKIIKFDKLKVPNLPFYITKSKTYYGLEEMKQGELDFFKGTVLSKSTKDVFMCSDMPMSDMAKDIDFGKKWMFAIAMCLKKGLHLNIIHNLDRPFDEMMLGLESWIPIYMTGQISPFYFKDNKTNIYHHFTYVSGSLSLSGECINGFHSKGKYHLSNKEKEINYYEEKAKLLLKKATPLMQIYTHDKLKEFTNFKKNMETLKGKRTRILSSFPIFFISDELLASILKRNNLTNDINKILKMKNEESQKILKLLNDNEIIDNIHSISEDETELLLINNYKVNINYEEMKKILKEYEVFAQKNNNYKIILLPNKIFNNITITIIENKLCLITKSKNPQIHFVIKHPKLLNAISNFNPLVKE